MRDSTELGWRAVGRGLTVIAVGALIVMSVASPAITAPKHHFKDNGDGTVTDNQTGLMWSQTTGALGASVECAPGGSCLDPTNVNNTYTWSASATFLPDGTLFTDFLATMNCALMESGGKCGPGPYHDWRIPTVAEWQSIMDCALPNCLDPIFGPSAVLVVSSVPTSLYWSVTEYAGIPHGAWSIVLAGHSPEPGGEFKVNAHSARAVRGG
jgi:hypothetical protein